LSNIVWRTTALLGATVVAWTAFAGANASALPASEPTPSPSPTAAAAPLSAPTGDNGTVKVHRTTTSADDPRNEPHVCGFYLVGFNFDPGQQVTWRIVAWPPTGDRTTVVLTNTLVLDANGHGRTADLGLPDGHYKLFWNFVGENGSAKHKVFWVDCDDKTPPTGPPPSGTPTPTSTTTVTPTETPSSSATPSQTPSEGAGQGGHSTSPPPAQVAQPEKSSGNLPLTGFAGRLLAALGAALVLGGAGAMFIARRRRGRHASTSS
jgi:LPXTG-motif cell wall-anchored protein